MKGAELIIVEDKQFLASLGSSFSGREKRSVLEVHGEGGRPGQQRVGHSRCLVRIHGRKGNLGLVARAL